MLKKFSGSILYILISLLVLSLYLDRHETLEKFELTIQDAMYQFRGKKDVAQDIVIVGIDDRSLSALGKWPWNRDKIAGLIDAIAAQMPKTIALDMTFGPDEHQQAAGFNDTLAKSIAGAGCVVLGYYYSQSDAGAGSLLPASLTKGAYRKFDDPALFAKYPPLVATKLYPPESSLADSAVGVGFVNVTIEKDRKVRWQPVLVGFRGEFFPAMQVVAAAHYLGINPDQLGIRVGRAVTLGARAIPTDHYGQMSINFNGPAGTFKYYSAADIVNKQTAPAELAGKLVVVGFSAYGATNVYATPISHKFSGLELDANVLENILHDNTLKGASERINVSFFIIIAIGLFSALILPKVSLLNRIAVLVLFLVVLLNINYILFSSFNQVTKTFYPALEIVFFLAAAPILKTAKEEKQDDDADDEVDYESLLSSSQKISMSSWEPPPLPPRQQVQTAAGRVSTVSGKSPLAGEATMPARSTSRAGVATALDTTPADHFGRYKILRPIGKGAMGMVFHGLDPAIDRPVALKTIRVDQGADEEETNELRERLMREAKAAGKLSHPNIVTIYDVGQEGTTQYIAMEYLQGNTLELLLKDGVDWDYRTISRVMIQVCEALDYAHENGIVHRDIKPANIMIVDKLKVKVMDFGIARLDKSASMTQTGTALGTPNYISPEQLKGQPVDRRSDIFSLGVVFYEVLTHEKPFKGDTLSALIYSILHTDPPRPSEINLDIPRIFDKIVAKALVKDPDLRFQRAKDVSDILRKLI